ncbi:hypothetical protein FA15DRAFT_753800 [Coprinopsis marcescibilis]|uniref:Rho termination factor N-terminal domain-containing protein n=1 Tax=Coprinopsis marcescibilis TaxID=230819 RepID=A0A5C3L5C1_COPMA|nr:hypothetical protein FA15DRAFT_753800 [Coprinopsis marcescibilis]
MDTGELARLTVPQLKALCKERRITGYSKLNKTGLLQKLGVEPPLRSTVAKNKTGCASSQSRVTAAPQNFVPCFIEANAAYTSDTLPTLTSGLSTLAPSRPGQPTATTASQEIVTPNLSHAGPAGTSSFKFVPELQTCTGSRHENETRPLNQECSQGSGSTTPLSAESTRQAQWDEISRIENSPGSNTHELNARKRKKAIETDKTAERAPKLARPLTGNMEAGQSKPSEYVLRRPNILRPLIPASSSLWNESHKERLVVTMAKTRNANSPIAPASRKKFAPLVPKNTDPVARPPPMTMKNRILEPLDIEWDHSGNIVSGSHLEFATCPAIPVLKPITLPPSIAQRKKVDRLASLMSLLTPVSLSKFAGLSRLHRYSVYVSAFHRLRREFCGLRLNAIVKSASPAMTNFWPYLRQRINERDSRKAIFCQSFLGRMFQSFPGIISPRIWSSSDNERQITVAIRFLMTLVYFHVSVGYDASGTFKSKCIVSADEIVQGEIWRINISSPTSGIQSYYALESTCEVVGLEESSGEEQQKQQWNKPLLRADWTSYIQYRLGQGNADCATTSKENIGLGKFLKWPNHEEYIRGISKMWLSKVEKHPDGSYKKTVAERYIMACVAGNSISGRTMTCSEMESDFNGRQIAGRLHAPPNKKLSESSAVFLNLYLPEHHLIESVHFTSRDGKCLHPAVAVVQTPGREYYILKDNGMQIGCEEDGIPLVWRNILSCDCYGISETPGL